MRISNSKYYHPKQILKTFRKPLKKEKKMALDLHKSITKKMLADENKELKNLLITEQKNGQMMKENIELLKKDQAKLMKNNKNLRKDITILSKGTKLTDEIVSRAQRYRKERDLLAEEVERLRSKIETLQIQNVVQHHQLSSKSIQKADILPVIHNSTSTGNAATAAATRAAKNYTSKENRIDAFAPRSIKELSAGMMVKFIGHTQRFDDISPVQEGMVEDVNIDLGGIVIVRVHDDDNETVFIKVPLRKVIVAWK